LAITKVEIMIYLPFFTPDKDEPADKQVYKVIKECTFKGIEADVVFIADTDKMKSNDKCILYTQTSRADLWLRVKGSKNSKKDYELCLLINRVL